MRYAFLADIHGRRQHLERVLAHVQSIPAIDEVICLGDLFEVKVPKRELASFAFRDLAEVVDHDDRLLTLLSGYRAVNGNQEDRLLELCPREALPAELRPFLLGLPAQIDLPEMAVVTHGHQFDWVDCADGYFHPVVTEWQRPWLFYGHNHQNALFRVRQGEEAQEYKRQEITFGQPMALDPQSHYLMNVGDIKRSTPSWVLYDAGEGTVTFYTLA